MIDFKNYANGRILKYQTIICPFKLQVEEAIKAKEDLEEEAISTRLREFRIRNILVQKN